MSLSKTMLTPVCYQVLCDTIDCLVDAFKPISQRGGMPAVEFRVWNHVDYAKKLERREKRKNHMKAYVKQPTGEIVQIMNDPPEIYKPAGIHDKCNILIKSLGESIQNSLKLRDEMESEIKSKNEELLLKEEAIQLCKSENMIQSGKIESLTAENYENKTQRNMADVKVKKYLKLTKRYRTKFIQVLSRFGSGETPFRPRQRTLGDMATTIKPLRKPTYPKSRKITNVIQSEREKSRLQEIEDDIQLSYRESFLGGSDIDD